VHLCGGGVWCVCVCVCVYVYVSGCARARARANGNIHKRHLMMSEGFFAALTADSSLLLLH
jgi:hypothetical protein